MGAWPENICLIFGVFILGKQLGNIVIGIQPTFGLRRSNETTLCVCSNTCIFTFYRWLKNDFEVDAFLHFGMHGAL